MRKGKSLNYTIDELIVSALDPRSDTIKNRKSLAPNQVQSAYSTGSTTPAGYSDWLNRGSSLVYDNTDTSSVTGNVAKSGGSGFGWASVVDNVINIGRDLLAYAHADKAAKVAYNRQNEFYDEHLSMPAKVQEYEEAGLNPMALGAAGPGTTSAPSVQQGSTPSAGGSGMELLSALLNYKLKTRELDLQEQMLPAKMEQAYADAEYKRESAAWVAPLAETNIAQMQSNIGLTLTKIGTEDSQRRLNEAGITETQAKAALTIQQAIYTEIQTKYADEWQRTEIALRRSQSILNSSETSLNRSKVDEVNANVQKIMDERFLLQAKVLESGALRGVLDQEASNLGIKGEMLEFDKNHQKARFVLEQVQGYTGVACDVVNTVANVASVVTGGGPMIQPQRKPIGFMK